MSKKNKKIAIIPARGGSKRIPQKNIRSFCGKPIIAYSIQAALDSKIFEEVMVSTDDKEISRISEKYNAKVPFLRSQINSDDFAPTSSVLLEVIENYKKAGKEFEYLCCIYPTAPFITPKILIDTFNSMLIKKADSIIPITKYSYSIQRSFKINDNGYLEYIWPENINKRSQDLLPAYHDAGLFYWINVNSFLMNKNLITNKTAFIELDELMVQDIDNESDWDIAELKYSLFQRNLNNEI